MADGIIAPQLTVPFKVTNPERIPARRYYDQGFYDLEVERLWPRTWQMATRLEGIPEAGDWAEYSNPGRPVMCVGPRGGIRRSTTACGTRAFRRPPDGGAGNCGSKGSTARSKACGGT